MKRCERILKTIDDLHKANDSLRSENSWLELRVKELEEQNEYLIRMTTPTAKAV